MPQAPILPETDSKKIDEIRRTVFISNLDKSVCIIHKNHRVNFIKRADKVSNKSLYCNPTVGF